MLFNDAYSRWSTGNRERATSTREVIEVAGSNHAIGVILNPTRLDQCDQPDCESMWISLRTHSLSRPMSSIILRVVYRSTADVQPENVALCDHIRINLDQLLWHQANSLVIVVRDVNSTSTGLRLNDLRRPNNLKQKVYFKTRNLGTSDCLLKNKPKVFGLSQLPNLATADHYVT